MIYTLEEWQQIVKDISGIIIQASSLDGNDSWQPFPVGMSWQFISNAKEALLPGTHEKLLLCGFRPLTDYVRRKDTMNRLIAQHFLEQNGFKNEVISPEEYFKSLLSYKFIISPEGNGVDCHRHYEALMAGCIPIMEYNPIIIQKYSGLPILYTQTYEEITKEYLETKYEELKRHKYDFSRLFLNFYSDEVQKQIKICGNFWLEKTTGSTWYSI
jgi:hypothetical protein